MNDDFELFETELAGLKPVVPSPRLREGLATELDVKVPTARKPFWRLPLSLAAALALCTSLPVILMRQNPAPLPLARPQEFTTPPELVFDPSMPSRWSYHRGLSSSSETLDSLLNRHEAARSSDTFSSTTAFRSFTSANPSALGEL